MKDVDKRTGWEALSFLLRGDPYISYLTWRYMGSQDIDKETLRSKNCPEYLIWARSKLKD